MQEYIKLRSAWNRCQHAWLLCSTVEGEGYTGGYSFTYLPTIVLRRVCTVPQSPVQEENLDQLVNWQSSWQGNWQCWVKKGIVPAHFRQ